MGERSNVMALLLAQSSVFRFASSLLLPNFLSLCLSCFPFLSSGGGPLPLVLVAAPDHTGVGTPCDLVSWSLCVLRTEPHANQPAKEGKDHLKKGSRKQQGGRGNLLADCF